MELVVKNLPANTEDMRDLGLIPGSGGSPGRGRGKPLQDSVECWILQDSVECHGQRSLAGCGP